MHEDNWPAFGFEEIFSEMCRGKRSLEEVQRVSPMPILMSRLTYPLDRLLDEHAPTTIQVASGSRIKVQYSMGQPPVLAVRLQELFGWTDTPRIAGGRVPVVLHLLGPNFRPVQITNDLRSFWARTYFQVRKDLRVRYPKHSWPEDPLSAKPQAKGGRRH
jgi:ATP-dependent helicase HrpB